MPGAVMPPMHVSAIKSPFDPIRSTSPRAIISEASPSKKRRLVGSFATDFDRHYGSRSGSLALLRVLSAPSSPRSNFIFNIPIQQQTLLPPMKPRPSPSPAHCPSKLPIDCQTTKPRPTPTKSTASTRRLTCPSISPSRDVATPARPACPELDAAFELAGPGHLVAERFLPPTSSDDFAAWVDPESITGPQVSLKQRLTKLAKGQSMVVVYPTQNGGSAFERLFSSLLDPILRRAVNTHNLKPEAAENIRNMDAIDTMFDAGDLASAIEGIIEASNTDRLTDMFEVKSAVTATVPVSTEYLKYHWSNQERSRVRAIVKEGLGNGGGAPVELAGIMMPRSHIRVTEEMLESLKTQKIEKWEQRAQEKEEARIEVGIFVLSRKGDSE